MKNVLKTMTYVALGTVGVFGLMSMAWSRDEMSVAEQWAWVVYGFVVTPVLTRWIGGK